jgi:hypothetical protein
MFEPDNEGYGLYGFNPQALDPQATNAINTEIISPLLTLAKRASKDKYTPSDVQNIVQRMARLTFTREEGSVNIEELLQRDLDLLG